MFKNYHLLFSILIAVFFLAACEKDDDESPDQKPVIESEVLASYLESTNSPLMKDYVNTDMPSIIKASDVKALNETGGAYIIDIRSAADYDSGHIENAHNLAVGDILTHIESTDLSSYSKVIVVCYTGQTAGFATCLLRLKGYDNVYSMKWGMCSWHTDFAGKWNTTVSNGNAYSSQFTSTASDKAAKGSMPSLSTGKSSGQEILDARVNALLTEGYGPVKIMNSEVFANLDNYYIVNYWSEAHYSDPGHIPGAIQYTPKESMKLSTDLKTLPTDKTIVVYCYTGQTSSFLAAYLRLLGYDAKSLLYGANGMIYDNMVNAGITSVFSSSQVMDYDYVN